MPSSHFFIQVSVTLDIWTADFGKDAMLGVTLHYIDRQSKKFVGYPIDLINVSDITHDGESMAEKVYSCLKERQLSTKVIFFLFLFF